VSVEEVLNILKSLPDGKSTSYDLMVNSLIIYAAPKIAAPLKYILEMYGNMLNCVQSRKTAKNPLLLPVVNQIVYSLHSVRYWSVF
jgi:hypothetical protein